MEKVWTTSKKNTPSLPCEGHQWSMISSNLALCCMFAHSLRNHFFSQSDLRLLQPFPVLHGNPIESFML